MAKRRIKRPLHKPDPWLPAASLADKVSHQELEGELQRLRGAITLLMECLGAHLVSEADARRLMALLTPWRTVGPDHKEAT